MGGYQQFCPLALAAEIVAPRWTPLVLRELLTGSVRFNDIHRGVPRMSRSLLSQRLSELERAGLVERRLVKGHPEYHLTRAGEELEAVIEQLAAWGRRWGRGELSPERVDVGLLMWEVQRHVARQRLPPQRVVIRFDFPDAPSEYRRWWLELGPEAAEVCLKDPGFAADLQVTVWDARVLNEVCLGKADLNGALLDPRVQVQGPRELRRELARWLAPPMPTPH